MSSWDFAVIADNIVKIEENKKIDKNLAEELKKRCATLSLVWFLCLMAYQTL